MKKRIGIYIHIPFCARKCKYCDFLSGPANIEVQNKYIEQLLGEMDTQSELLKDRIIETVFFGGGTPSILDGAEVVRIMKKLRKLCEISETAEISIEANPGTVT